MYWLTNLFRFVSLKRLVLIGFTLAVLPLAWAIVTQVFAIEDLARLSKDGIDNVRQRTDKVSSLGEKLRESNRRGAQYLVLQEKSAQENFESSRTQFIAAVTQLRGITKSENLIQQLDQLLTDELTVYQRIVSHVPEERREPDRAGTRVKKSGKLAKKLAGDRERTRGAVADDPMKDLKQQVKDLESAAEKLESKYEELAGQEAAELQVRWLQLRERLLMQSAWLLPLSGVVITFFIYMITRPIRQMDQAIRALGAGNLVQPIKVRGPRDLEYLGERLEWLRSRLKNLEVAKQRFIGNVSHEIKTPLATIHEGIELLADDVVGHLNAEQKEIAQIIVGNTHKLDTLIAGLINYGQVDAQVSERKLEHIDVRDLVLNLIDDYQIQLRSKSLAVIERLAPVAIDGDPRQMRTIVDNLLSNAVKYSPIGGEIRIGLRKDGGHMELEIEDDGPGIDADERLHVFDPYFQGRAAKAVGVKGTGFGLAIVSEFVASHRGKVEVMEPHGGKRGARVRVKIPLKAVI